MDRLVHLLGIHGVEAVFLLLLIGLAARPPQALDRLCRGVLSLLRRVAARRAAVVVGAGLGAVALRLALLPGMPVPVPIIHDEFSYLLAADTYQHGRLTNPSPPLWPHFETFHVIVQPFYASKYPIGQGVVLAVGKLLFGHPWAGVLLNWGLLAGALCWMLQGWVPPLWALVPVLLLVPRVGCSYWVNGYMGGILPATGACLLLGVWARLRRTPRWHHGLLFTIGSLLIAHSRPIEGAVFAAGTLLFMLGEGLARRGADRARLWCRVLAPAVVAGVLAAASVMLVNWRVTSRPLLFPHVFYQQQYGMAPFLFFLPPAPEPALRTPEFQSFFTGWEMEGVWTMRSAHGFASTTLRRAIGLWHFWFGTILTLALLVGGRAWLQPRERRVGLLALACFGLNCVVPWYCWHYSFGTLMAITVLFAASLRRTASLRWPSSGTGRVLLVGLLVGSAATARLYVSGLPLGPWVWDFRYPRVDYPIAFREPVVARLHAIPGKHLVIVRYRPEHPAGQEWVYNEANLERARIVWARELDPRENARLIAHFAGHKVWLLDPDPAPLRLEPYVGQ